MLSKILKGLSAAIMAAAAAVTLGCYSNISVNAYELESHTQSEIREMYQKLYFDVHDLPEYTQDYSVTSPYSAGEISEQTLTEALNSVNFARYLAGLPYDVELDDDYNVLTQHASLVNYMNGTISHYPTQPDGLDDDLYSLGYTGAGRSNIAIGYANIQTSVIFGYLDDSDDSNIGAVGHRRWILNPSMQYTGFGIVGNSTAMYSFDSSRSEAFTGDYICWPPENMPYEFVNSESNGYAFSVSLGSSYDTPSLSKVTVEVTSKLSDKTWYLDSSSTSVSSEYLTVENSGYGIAKCIIFNVGALPENDVIDITINGIYKNGVETPISYTVNYFNLLDDSDYEIGFEESEYTIAVGESIILKSYNNPLKSLNVSFAYYTSALNYIDFEILGADIYKITGKAEGTAKILLAYNSQYLYDTTIPINVVSAASTVSLSDCTVTLPSSSYTFTGDFITPTPTITNGSTTLTNGVDYTLSYSNNIKAGTATITITGKNNVTGSVTKTFTIAAKSLSYCTVTLPASQYTFTGKTITPTPTVKIGDTTIYSGNYTLSYSNNIKAGTATITITGKNNLKGSVTKTFTIVAKSLSYCTVTLPASQYTFTGKAITPTPTVKIGDTTIYSGNYTLSYSNNIKAGTATITITGKNNLKGSVTKTFTIVPKSLSYCTVTLSKNSSNQYQPTVTVKIADCVIYSGNYDVTYKTSSDKKTVTVTIAGKNNLTGSVTKTYTV